MRGRAELADGDQNLVAPPCACGHAMTGMPCYLANGWAKISETSPDDAPKHTLQLYFYVIDQKQKLVYVFLPKFNSDIYPNVVFEQLLVWVLGGTFAGC